MHINAVSLGFICKHLNLYNKEKIKSNERKNLPHKEEVIGYKLT